MPVLVVRFKSSRDPSFEQFQIELTYKNGAKRVTTRLPVIDVIPIFSAVFMRFNFVGRSEIACLLNLSPGTIKVYQRKKWIEGVHFIRVNSRVTRFNFQLIEDWLHNINDDLAHQKAIEACQSSQLSNQRKVRQCKALSAVREEKWGLSKLAILVE